MDCEGGRGVGVTSCYGVGNPVHPARHPCAFYGHEAGLVGDGDEFAFGVEHAELFGDELSDDGVDDAAAAAAQDCEL